MNRVLECDYWVEFDGDESTIVYELEQQFKAKFTAVKKKSNGTILVGTNSLALKSLLADWAEFTRNKKN